MQVCKYASSPSKCASSPSLSAGMQALRAPRVAPRFIPVRRRFGIRRCKVTVSPRASLQDLVRVRGIFAPNNVVQDFTTLTAATLLTTAVYVALTQKKPTGKSNARFSLSWYVILDMHAQTSRLFTKMHSHLTPHTQVQRIRCSWHPAAQYFGMLEDTYSSEYAGAPPVLYG